MLKWFQIAQALAGAEGVAKIIIDGEIGGSWWDDTAVASHDFMNAVKGLGDLQEIIIDLNSPGGSVTDGLTIANYLRQHEAKVVVNVLGQASSIASVIAAAADEVNMGLGAFGLVHQPWTVMVGNADEMRAMAKDLDTINDGILEAYVAKVGEDNREAMAALIKGDDGQGTILSAEQWIELGLADSMMEVKAAASSCLTSLHKAMAKAADEASQVLQERHPEEAPLTAAAVLAVGLGISLEDLEADLEGAQAQFQVILDSRESTLDSIEITQEFLQSNHPALVQAIGDAAGATALEAERERVLAIVRASATTGTFSNLEKLISENWAADQAADLILASAGGAPHISGHHSPEGGQKAGIDHSKIYARRNRRQTA